MALSTNTFTYTGGEQTFTLSLSLGYLEESDITAFVVGDLDGEGAQLFRAFTFDSEFVVRLTDPLTINDEVTLERTVDKESFTVDFETGGDVTARNLMILYKQVFMAQQELLDGRVGAFNPVGDSENAQAAAAEALISELAAKVSEDLAELDRIATAADRVVTTADAVNTSADAIQTAADRVVTTADAIATAADEADTSADAINTAADAAATAGDRVQTGLDKVAAGLSADLAEADQVQTGLDRVQTGLDRTQTGLDAVDTGVDATATGIDAAATAQDAIDTAQDSVDTNADKIAAAASASAASGFADDAAADAVLTGLDVVSTGADVVSTGNDVTAASGSAAAAAASATDALSRHFDNRAAVVASTISAGITSIVVEDYATSLDGGGGRFRRVASDPAPTISVRSNGNTVWWELESGQGGFITVAQAGVIHDDRTKATANTVALQAAIDSAANMNAKLDLGPGTIFVNGRILLDAPITIVGRGNTYWPSNSAARRSTTTDTMKASPSQIVFTGTGTRNQEVFGISSMRNCGADRTNLSRQSGYNDSGYRLLSFTEDSATTTRTQKQISVAWHVQSGAFGSSFSDFRILLDGGGDDALDGYFGVIGTSEPWAGGNSDWDIGVYNDTTYAILFDNIQVVGPWKMAGMLMTITPSDGTFATMTQAGNPGESRCTNCVFEGYKALSIRGYDSFQIAALTTTSVSVPWADDHPFAASGNVYLATNQHATTKFAYTGITKVAATGFEPDLLRFDGLVDDPTGSYSTGNNVHPQNHGASSGITFDKCRFGGMHHPSGYPCHYASLAEPMDFPGGGVEISGFKITEITFKDWVIQHNEQVGFHMHECREIYWDDTGQAEGNRPEGIDDAGLRFIASPHHSLTTDRILGAAAIHVGGSGYTVGDILTIVPGTFTKVAKLEVLTVGGGGEVTSIQVVVPGLYTSTLSIIISVTGGSGTLATFNLDWFEQYTSGDTFSCYYGSSDMIFGDGNDFRPLLPLNPVERWSHVEDNGFFDPNHASIPKVALRAEFAQGTGVVAPVGGRTGLLRSTPPGSGSRFPDEVIPDYGLFFDDALDRVMIGSSVNDPEELLHVRAKGSATDTNGIRVTGFRPHLTLEDASGGARDWQLWVDSAEMHILYGDAQSNNKLTGVLVQFLQDIVKPGSNNTVSLGTVSRRWSEVYSEALRVGSEAVVWTTRAGVPEGFVTGGPGSLYTNSNGGAGTTLWVKESGTGNTGWVVV